MELVSVWVKASTVLPVGCRIEAVGRPVPHLHISGGNSSIYLLFRGMHVPLHAPTAKTIGESF